MAFKKVVPHIHIHKAVNLSSDRLKKHHLGVKMMFFRCYFVVMSRLIQVWKIRGKTSVLIYFKMLESIAFMQIIENQI